jgi:ubiquinone/menaquinone biosynthesis methyltransferase
MPPPSNPPSDLRVALDQVSEKQPWVDWLFSRVAARYDLGNDIMSLGWHVRWKRRLVDFAELKPDERVLDLATGTGDIAFLIADQVREVIGSDINAEMLEIAEQKRPPGMDNVTFVRADAVRLPFPDASFDVVLCSYAGRGFPAWPPVLAEVHRVLKPGGRFLNLDFARPPQRLWDAAYRGWLVVSGAVLGTVLHGDPQTYVYIPLSMKAYPGQRWLDARMQDAGFQTRLVETLGCLMAYNVGHKPSR